MASREEKIASARKKLKKFQQRGTPKGNKTNLNSSALEPQTKSNGVNGPVVMSSTFPRAGGDRQDWSLGDMSSAGDDQSAGMVNGMGVQAHASRSNHSSASSANGPMAGSDYSLPNSHSNNAPGPTPTTPVQPAAPDFLPASTSTPHPSVRQENGPTARSYDGPTAMPTGLVPADVVSPTHFGFKGSTTQPHQVNTSGSVSSLGTTSASSTGVSASTSFTATSGTRQPVATAMSSAAPSQPQSQQPVPVYQGAVDGENLKKQLTAHQQTIDVLVEEKNSLQAVCTKYEQLVRQRDTSIMNLNQQMRTSSEQNEGLRSQLAQREADVRAVSRGGQHSDADVAALNAQLQQARQQAEAAHHQVSELSRRVQSRATECTQLRQERDQFAEKLQTTSTLLQQASSDDSVAQLRQAHQAVVDEKGGLEQQMSNLSTSLQRAVEERDMAVQQCRQAMEQTSTVKQHLDQERVVHKQQQDQLQQHLEKQAAQVNELKHQLDLTRQSGENASIEKLQGMQRSLQSLAVEKQSLTEELSKQSSHSGQLQKLSGQQAERIRQLEEHVARMSETSDQRQQLLTSVQADKAAISQATLANRDLRQRIEEMESLQEEASQQRKELEERLSANAGETTVLEERLEQKAGLLRQVQADLAASQGEVESLHSENDSLSDQLAKHVQMQNRRQHLEAQSQLTDALQQELTAAQEAIKRLQAEKDQLRQTVMQQQALINSGHDTDAEEEDTASTPGSTSPSRHQSASHALAGRIQALEDERANLVHQLQEQSQRYQQEVASLQEDIQRQKQLQQVQRDPVEMEVLRQSGSSTSIETAEFIPRQQYNAVQNTLEELQERFLTIMTEKADLVQKVHSLEHVAGQLEGETNTIGEYITLYQLQRDTLRKRYEKKDEYIDQLREEQARMEDKVEELHNLVMDLVADRKSLIGRLLQLQSHISAYSTMNDGTAALGSELNTPARPSTGPGGGMETSTPSTAGQDALSPSSMPGVFEGDESELFAPHLSKVGSTDVSLGMTPSESQASLPSGIATSEQRAEKILAILQDLKPSMHVPELTDEDTARNGSTYAGPPRIGIDMEFHPCSHCEGRLVRL
ncbi:golgin subfamily A member 2-like isoform X2 [Sycon ciliatum]|uniref:golgin subfamily A member 2-like isoform X2 n=1 Tax=Sycon ciliatum TaxID=27933 RepID=UPI0031F70D3F